LLLVHLCGPKHRPNSSLYSAAQSREQAALIFFMAAKIVRMSPELRGNVIVREATKELRCPELGTRYRALSAEATTAFGLSPVFIIHDELGLVRGPRSTLYEALETATGAQDDPLTIIISTQAPSDGDLLSMLIDDAQAGYDPRTVVKLYSAPMGDDPFATETIIKANPAFGNFLNDIEVTAMADDARRMPAREAEFRNLILNQRVEACNAFVKPAQWAACSGAPESIEGCDIYAGLDLSATTDLTAMVLIGKKNGIWHVHPTFWLPAEGLFEKSRADRVPYDEWHKNGFLLTTPGSSVHYHYVAQYLRGLFDRYKIRKVGFDRWNYKHFKPWLIEAGFSEYELENHWVEFGQGTQSMSPALRELEQMIVEGELRHGNHPVLNMCATHAVVESPDESNRKLSKKKSSGRIDGMVALAMAVGVKPMATKVDIRSLIA
jgi:phage terminase large subunit-like protein